MSGSAGAIIILVAVAIYFLPCVVAETRHKSHGMFGIFVLNLCLGWTVVGWFAALIWASSGTTDKEKREDARRHKELMQALTYATRNEAAVAPVERREPRLVGKR
jgi:hypothetical protein